MLFTPVISVNAFNGKEVEALNVSKIENDYYSQLLFAKLTMGNILIGFAIIIALIEEKLQRRKKNEEKIKNES